MSGRPTPEQAQHWLRRWDEQQQYYIPDREARFEVVVEVLRQTLSRPEPLVVDLGVGPGSLAHRVVDRLPGARVVGIDADPLLMQLGETARPHERVRTVLADLRSDDWMDALRLERAPDAFVSSTALHWMDRTALGRLFATCRAAIATGGVLVDADHLYETAGRASRLDQLGRAMTAHRAAAIRERAEDWQQWWRAAETAPELADLVRERAGGFAHTVTEPATVHDYVALLREAGFAEAGTVWQVGDDRVVVALA